MAFDLASRVPCPDGTCVGIIGKNGRCGTCGKEASAELRARAEAAAASAAADEDGDPEPSGDEAALGSDAGDAARDGDAADGGFDPGRRLCVDGACIGVIGPEGRCKVCGLEADAPAP